MKRALTTLALVLWIVIASLFLTWLWTAHPEQFPTVPKPVAEDLATLYKAQNAEDVADLEIVVGLTINIVLVSIVTCLAWLISRRKS